MNTLTQPNYNDEKTIWNYYVKIFSGDICVAELYYYTGLDLDKEWFASFLNEYIIKIDVSK